MRDGPAIITMTRNILDDYWICWVDKVKVEHCVRFMEVRRVRQTWEWRYMTGFVSQGMHHRSCACRAWNWMRLNKFGIKFSRTNGEIQKRRLSGYIWKQWLGGLEARKRLNDKKESKKARRGLLLNSEIYLSWRSSHACQRVDHVFKTLYSSSRLMKLILQYVGRTIFIFYESSKGYLDGFDA